MKKLKKLIKRHVKKNTYKVPFEPMSNVFGVDRGSPIDRLYMTDFLHKHQEYITGNCAEFGWPNFALNFEKNINEIHSFNCKDYHKNFELDLMDSTGLPNINFYDIIICTNVLNFIPELELAVENMMRMLKPNGVALITVAGPSMVSLYDYERWGDYWRFTDKGLHQLFKDYQIIASETYGNFYASAHFLNGSVTEEVDIERLAHKDCAFQILNCIAVMRD